MDKARQQAYLNLIEQLLTCTNNEEGNNILQAHQELLDREFLQEMARYADELEEQQPGDNNAVKLRNLVQHLTYDAITIGTSQTYLCHCPLFRKGFTGIYF